MAKVVTLYETVSAVTGQPLSRCRNVSRWLQNAGLLPVGKRGGGKNAPPIDATDAARFLIGLACPVSLNEMPALADRFGNLRRRAENPTPRGKWNVTETTLLEDLTARIEARRRGEDDPENGKLRDIYFALSAQGTSVAFEFSLALQFPNNSPSVFAELSDIVPFFEPNNIDWDPFKHGRPGEMVTYISFEGRILDVLADVLGPADEDAAE